MARLRDVVGLGRYPFTHLHHHYLILNHRDFALARIRTTPVSLPLRKGFEVLCCFGTLDWDKRDTSTLVVCGYLGAKVHIQQLPFRTNQTPFFLQDHRIIRKVSMREGGELVWLENLSSFHGSAKYKEAREYLSTAEPVIRSTVENNAPRRRVWPRCVGVPEAGKPGGGYLAALGEVLAPSPHPVRAERKAEKPRGSE